MFMSTSKDNDSGIQNDEKEGSDDEKEKDKTKKTKLKSKPSFKQQKSWNAGQPKKSPQKSPQKSPTKRKKKTSLSKPKKVNYKSIKT